MVRPRIRAGPGQSSVPLHNLAALVRVNLARSELLYRLDKAIAQAAENNTTIDEVNPLGGFEPDRL